MERTSLERAHEGHFFVLLEAKAVAHDCSLDGSLFEEGHFGGGGVPVARRMDRIV